MLPTARGENKSRTAKSSLFPYLSVEERQSTNFIIRQVLSTRQQRKENAIAVDEHLAFPFGLVSTFSNIHKTPLNSFPCNAMPRLATLCISISIVPPHIQYQLPNLPRIQIPKPTLNRSRLVQSNPLLVSAAKSYSPIVHPLSSKRPTENHGIDRDEATTISVQCWWQGVYTRRVTYRVAVRPSLRNMTPYCVG
jgi:hypothetical protein